MATRTYCDHCGKTIHTPVRYCFGPFNVYNSLTYNQQYGQVSQGLYTATVGIVTPPPPTPGTQLEVIDLCPTCEGVWMKRVKKLTSEDPECLPSKK
jgi:hypothetical protein